MHLINVKEVQTALEQESHIPLMLFYDSLTVSLFPGLLHSNLVSVVVSVFSVTIIMRCCFFFLFVSLCFLLSGRFLKMKLPDEMKTID